MTSQFSLKKKEMKLKYAFNCRFIKYVNELLMVNKYISNSQSLNPWINFTLFPFSIVADYLPHLKITPIYCKGFRYTFFFFFFFFF